MSAAFRRGQTKAAITKFKTFIDEFTDTPSNQAKLQQRIDNLKEVIKNLQSMTEKLVEQDPEFIQGNHGDIETEIMENYMDALAAAELLKPAIIPGDFTTTSSSTSNPSVDNPHQSQNNIHQTLTRIPKVELRKFDGSIENWKSFSDWFIGTIHTRSGITDSMKLQYLHDTLIGEAAETIAGFEATNENYKEAWDLLTLTYNNDRVIIFRHFELLTTIPKMSNNSAESIRHLINEVQVQVRKMKVLGQPTEHWDVPLVHITTSKLDNATKREWNRKITGTSVPTFEELITFLREEATKMQSTNVKEICSTPTKHKENKIQKDKRQKQVLTTTTYKNCPICTKDGHQTFRCEKLINLSVPQRINAVKAAHLCLNRLRPNHQTNACFKGNCFKCGKHHHTFLHLVKSEDKNEEVLNNEA